MEFVAVNIVLPLIIGVITEVMVSRAATQIDWLQGRRALSIMIAVLVTLILAFSLLFLPPVQIAGVNWCATQASATKITGRLTTTLLGLSVAGESVQIKVFEAGRNDPLAPDVFVTTNAEGVFSIDTPQLSPSSNPSYVINTAYRYVRPILGERWQVTDFNKGTPGPCP